MRGGDSGCHGHASAKAKAHTSASSHSDALATLLPQLAGGVAAGLLLM